VTDSNPAKTLPWYVSLTEVRVFLICRQWR